MAVHKKHGSHGKVKKHKVSASGKKRVGKKIGKLRREGKSAKQAAGQAFSMESEGRLGPKGGKRKNTSRSKATRKSSHKRKRT